MPAPPRQRHGTASRAPPNVHLRVLEGLEHQGIQRVLDYREAELGPALVFEYDPDALRLDRFISGASQSWRLLNG